MWFPHKETETTVNGHGKCTGYRLASPAGNANAHTILNAGNFGYGWFGEEGYGLRPCVYIPNNVGLEKDGDGYRIYGTFDGTTEPQKVTPDQSLVGSDVQYTDIDGDEDTYDWKLFYVVPENDETTEVANEDAGAYYLITSDYLDCSKETNFPTTGENSAVTQTGMSGANGTYSRYWPNAPTGNFSTAYDAIGDRDTSKNKKFYLDYFKDYKSSGSINARGVAGILNPNYWAHLKRSNAVSGEEVIGSPTIELWCKAWNSKGYTTLYCDNADQTGYYVGWSSSPSTTYVTDVSSKSSTGYGDKMFYPHTSKVDSECCLGFWLASPSTENR